MKARQRVVEWENNPSKFNLEYFNPYDGNWHLRHFDNNNHACVFNTLLEAKTYAIDNPMILGFKIHEV